MPDASSSIWARLKLAIWTAALTVASWFRPKRYGYGLTPATWQGWVFTVTLVPILALVAVIASR